jgi:hypothetical protein
MLFLVKVKSGESNNANLPLQDFFVTFCYKFLVFVLGTDFGAFVFHRISRLHQAGSFSS